MRPLFFFLCALSLPAESLTGRIADPSSAPLSAASVTLLRNNAPAAASSSDADGNVLLSNLPPGRFHLTVSTPYLLPLHRAILMEPGRDLHLDLQLSLLPLASQITVTAEAATPLEASQST